MASCESELALRPEKVNDVRRAPRFSLRALLAVLATVALALAIWVSFRVAQENKELRVENDQLRIKLRNEFGVSARTRARSSSRANGLTR